VPRSVEVADDFGRLLATFHDAVADFTPPRDAAWTALHPFALVGGDPDWIDRLYADESEDRALLVAWREEALAALNDAPDDDSGMCHGEAYPATCRHTEEGLAIAELDWAGLGQRAYDLATFRWILALHASGRDESLFTMFVDSYGAVREPPDLSAVRAWVAARHLWSLRLAAGFADRAGLKRRASFALDWPIGL
jgi:Ser/Thr protein kinase RdoA (MazF antagonist)